MNLVVSLIKSSIGKKFLMAVTGIVLLGFVAGHLVGNLQIFAHPDKINGYAAFLQGLGPMLWVVRLTLLACVGIHIWAAVALTLENRAARGPEKYGVNKWLNATFASRYMQMSGAVILAFIVYHLMHFTIGNVQSCSFKTTLAHQYGEYVMTSDFHLMGFPIVAKGAEVHDVYSMVFLGFMNPIVSIFYIIAVGLLSMHLLHGADSLVQTFGIRNSKWACCLRRCVTILTILYFLGNLAIPGAILSGIAKPAEGTTAAKLAASCSSCSSCTK